MNEINEIPEVYNQTTFASQEPVMQNVEPMPEKPAEKMSSQKRLLLILGVVMATCLVLLLIAGATMQRRRNQAQLTASPTPEIQQAGPTTELGQALKDTETVITAADPTVNNLPFPPVNFGITIKFQKI